MSKYFSSVLFLVVTSCCDTHREATYTFEFTTIKRVDTCGKTTFYYERNGMKLPGKIWVEYSGINDGFSGYLEFKENGKVNLLSGDGYFESENMDESYFEFRDVGAGDLPKSFHNIYYVALAMNTEAERNKKLNSNVIAKY